jgi:hypothetical protein
MPSRRWSQWPKRLSDEVSATSGMVGLLGAGVTVAGIVFAAPVTIALGGAVFGGTILWAGLRAIPPKLPGPQEMTGRLLGDLSELDSIHPPPKRIGFIGVSQAGKSTLLDHLEIKPARPGRTDDPYASIISISGNPLKYFALIGAAGQVFSQQFKVVDNFDILVIFLDHNKGHGDQKTNERRLREHENFLEQLHGHLKQNRKRISRIHFLLNKGDLWERDAGADRLKKWFADQVKGWKMAANAVTNDEHSNRRAQDIAKMAQNLRRWA